MKHKAKVLLAALMALLLACPTPVQAAGYGEVAEDATVPVEAAVVCEEPAAEELIGDGEPDSVTDWSALQAQINEAQDGVETEIVLEEDLLALSEEGCLLVPEKKIIVLNLNGHTIDRNLDEPVSNGCVIKIYGTLTIRGEGIITGGSTISYGGGIAVGEYNHWGAVLNLEGGTITGNNAKSGGGVFVYTTSTLNMSGGSITENTADEIGGGVYLHEGFLTQSGYTSDVGYMNIFGCPNVTGNTAGGKASDVGFGPKQRTQNRIHVTEQLDSNAQIGFQPVEDYISVPFTEGLLGKGTVDCFVSDDPEYGIFETAEGEALLSEGVTVSFEAGYDGSAETMDPLLLMKDSGFVLPDCAFAGPEDMRFAGWSVAIGDAQPVIYLEDESITVTADTTVTAVWSTGWAVLQQQIDEAQDDVETEIVLEEDLLALPEEGCLLVPEKKNIVLNLNGHTIDRNLDEPVSNGCVIKIYGMLTIRGDGIITGGSTTSYGGGIAVGEYYHWGAVLNLEGGTITGNNAKSGGGVFVYTTSTLNMSGGSITGNTADEIGGGVYLQEGFLTQSGYTSDVGYMDIFGCPNVTGNTAGGKASDVEFGPKQTTRNYIHVTGELDSDARIGFQPVEDYISVPFTEGLSGKGTVDCFVSDDPEYRIFETADGEALLSEGVTVSFEAGYDGSAETMDPLLLMKDSSFVLPDCAFAGPEGLRFGGWSVVIGDAQPVIYMEGESITVTADTTVTAVWSYSWAALQQEIDEAPDHEETEITLVWDVRALPEETCLTVSEEKNIVLDLNGHTIDRGLQRSRKPDGYVINVLGSLTITDTSACEEAPYGTGKITGGNTVGDCGGIYVSGRLVLNNGTIAGNTGYYGGGVFIEESGEFAMDNGSVSNNKADISGGGVYTLGKFILNNGTVSGNRSYNGGAGVYIKGKEFIMNNGTIKGNTTQVEGARGGGVFIEGKSSAYSASFLMMDGEISGNTATNSGGVYIGSYVSSVRIYNGRITGNTALKECGGINIYERLFISSAPYIFGNTDSNGASNVLLESSGLISAAGGVWADAKIGVTRKDGPGVMTSNIYGNATASRFSSDNPDYRIRMNDQGKLELYEPEFYTIMAHPSTGGSVDSDVRQAAEGDTVTLEVSCGYGYKLDTLYVSSSEGNVETLRTGLTTFIFTMPEGDVTVSAQFGRRSDVVFTRKNILLSGAIGVNFYMDLSGLDEMEQAESYMTFSISGKGTTTAKDVFDAEYMNSTGEYYGFTCRVNAIQMADTITAVFHYQIDGEEYTVSDTYSVQQYIREYIELADEEPDVYGEMLPLVQALGDYGHYAQIMLSRLRGWQIGTDYAEIDAAYRLNGFSEEEITTIQDRLEAVPNASKSLNADIARVTYGLQLDSETAVLMYIRKADTYKGPITVRINGEEVTAKKQKDGRYKVTIPDIGPQRMSETFNVRVETDGSDVPSEISFSALTYVKAYLARSDAQQDEKDAMAALHMYSYAAYSLAA